MNVSDFDKNYLNTLYDKSSKEIKQLILLSGLNINLLNYNYHENTNKFLDSLASNSFIPYLFQPTKLLVTQKTLIDKTFSNTISLHNIWQLNCNNISSST